MERHHPEHPVLVIGGGLAGLTAAAYLARAGRSVTVYEKARKIGGRAQTQEKQGFRLNLGPHALYRNQAGERVLAELGIPYHGGPPPTAGVALYQGKLFTLPTTPSAMLATNLLTVREKLAVGRFFLQLRRLDADRLASLPLSTWLDQNISRPKVRQLVELLVRIATYTGDLDALSAGAALRQARIAFFDSVTYIDGGWQVLVHGLQKAVVQAGGRIETGCSVVAIARDGAGAVSGVHLENGTRIPATAVIIAADPATVQSLIDVDLPSMQPVQMATLGVALSGLPNPKALLAMGMDQPLYLSVHSTTAKLAPAGGALIHTGKYLSPGPHDLENIRAELETVLDQAQAGWRDLVVEQRFLPRLTVTHALVAAANGGLAGRPDIDASGVAGLFLAGDWVGPDGMLSDTSFASGKRAAEEVRKRYS